MENASKAILIAGAVLIVLVLIGIAVVVAYIGSDKLDDVSNTTINGVQIRNQVNKFMKYEGQVTGAQVKQCISAAIAHNSNLKADEAELAITIYAPARDRVGSALAVNRAVFNTNGGKQYYVDNYMHQAFYNNSICNGVLKYNANNGSIQQINFTLIRL